MERCGVDKIAKKGWSAEAYSSTWLDRERKQWRRGETFGPRGPAGRSRDPGRQIEKHDNLLIRTGWLSIFYDEGPDAFFGDTFVEPGLTYSEELVRWFHEQEIVSLTTDTIANETTADPETGIVLPLHAALMRNLACSLGDHLARRSR